jgi:hypothetical protein
MKKTPTRPNSLKRLPKNPPTGHKKSSIPTPLLALLACKLPFPVLSYLFIFGFLIFVLLLYYQS